MIDLQNYEAFLLDYFEGTISEQDKLELEKFLAAHPELPQISDSFEPAFMVPDESVSFPAKHKLRKNGFRAGIIIKLSIPAVAAGLALLLYFNNENVAVKNGPAPVVDSAKVQPRIVEKEEGSSIAKIEEDTASITPGFLEDRGVAAADPVHRKEKKVDGRNIRNQAIEVVDESQRRRFVNSDKIKSLDTTQGRPKLELIEKKNEEMLIGNNEKETPKKELAPADSTQPLNLPDDNPNNRKGFFSRIASTVRNVRSFLHEPGIQVQRTDDEDGKFALKIKTKNVEIVGVVPSFKAGSN